MMKDLQDKYTELLNQVKYLHLTKSTQEKMLTRLSKMCGESLEVHTSLCVMLSLIQVKANQFQILGKLDVGKIIYQLERMNSEKEVDDLFQMIMPFYKSPK